MANGVRYGLAASVFSENVGRAMKDRREARLRHRLDQRASLPAHPRDAPRRLQGVGLREGHVDLLDGGVHPRQARRREARCSELERTGLRREASRAYEPQLEQDAIGFREALAIGLASTAPAYSLAAVIGTVTVVVGFQAPAAMLASFVPMFLIAGAFFYMNRADQDAGTTFSWVTRAMGPWLGWLGGWAVCTTGILVVGSLADVGRALHVRASRLGIGGGVEARGDGARGRVHRVDDGDLHHRHRADRGDSRRADRPSDRSAAPLRGSCALQGVRRHCPCRLFEARARLVLALRHLEHVDARLGAPDRGLHLLGLGERSELDGGDSGLGTGARSRRRRLHGDPARHIRGSRGRCHRVCGARDDGRVRRRRRDLRVPRCGRPRIAVGQARDPRDRHVCGRVHPDDDHPVIPNLVLDGAAERVAAQVRSDPPALPHSVVLDGCDRRSGHRVVRAAQSPVRERAVRHALCPLAHDRLLLRAHRFRVRDLLPSRAHEIREELPLHRGRSARWRVDPRVPLRQIGDRPLPTPTTPIRRRPSSGWRSRSSSGWASSCSASSSSCSGVSAGTSGSSDVGLSRRSTRHHDTQERKIA